MKRIIVLCTDSNYVKATYITMNSIASYVSDKEIMVCFYIILNSTDDKDEDLLKDIEQRYKNVKVKIIKSVNMVQEKPDNATWITPTTYLRLRIPDLIKEEVCLYVDQDIAIRGDLTKIFEFDLGDNLIAAVRDPFVDQKPEKHRDFLRYYNYDITKDYINAGVLLMNLKKIRKSDWNRKVNELISVSFPERDQDILNIVCKDRVLFLPDIFNRNSKDNRENLAIPILIHFTGPLKPWKDIYISHSKEWWNECKKTFLCKTFREDIADQLLTYYLGNVIVAQSKEEVWRVCSEAEKIIIFGAGKIANNVIGELQKERLVAEKIFVTERTDQPEKIRNVKVASIKEASPIEFHATFLIATVKDTSTIVQLLQEHDADKIIVLGHLFR